MYLQGDLQLVFDALYHMGVIDPVLKMDWAEALDKAPEHQAKIDRIVAVANRHQADLSLLMDQLKIFDEKSLSYLAMEVAREFADFHSRQESLHS
jgi:hypothetical protein